MPLRRRRKARLLAVLCSGALLVSGCGGSNSEPASTAGTAATSTAPPDAKTFTDPAGAYEIGVADSWKETEFRQLNAWIVGKAADGFAPNVNVVTETFPSGIALDDYLKASVDKAPQQIQEFDLESSETITLASGAQGGRLVYRGRSGTSPTLKFLAIVAFRDGRAAVATFTSLPDRFDALAAETEPYLRTLSLPDR